MMAAAAMHAADTFLKLAVLAVGDSPSCEARADDPNQVEEAHMPEGRDHAECDQAAAKDQFKSPATAP